MVDEMVVLEDGSSVLVGTSMAWAWHAASKTGRATVESSRRTGTLWSVLTGLWAETRAPSVGLGRGEPGNPAPMGLADSMELAASAGLNYAENGAPGYRRIRRGRGFSYLDPRGNPVNGRKRESFAALAIPPAWTDVWISADPSSHIQATGYDDAGRKQYIYHPDWEAARDEVKFERMGDFGAHIGRLRRRVEADLRQPGMPRRKVIALAVALLDQTLIRVGNRKYADENEAYGLTTLTCDHVTVRGSRVQLDFSGKGGADHQLVVEDARLARLVAKCRGLGGDTLLSYQNGVGLGVTSSTDVNDYLAETMGGPFTAKDFRTWGASTAVTEFLAGEARSEIESEILAAIDATAEKLGNTREVCRDSYVHPSIPDAYREGSLREAWVRSRSGRWLTRPESTVNRLLRGT
jgi:DNA topoisomerase-1